MNPQKGTTMGPMGGTYNRDLTGYMFSPRWPRLLPKAVPSGASGPPLSLNQSAFPCRSSG